MKEAQAAARKEAARRSEELQETIKTVIMVCGVLLVTVGLFVILMISIAKGHRLEESLVLHHG